MEDALALYERAFSDYQCAKLWPDYLETLEESLDVRVTVQYNIVVVQYLVYIMQPL